MHRISKYTIIFLIVVCVLASWFYKTHYKKTNKTLENPINVFSQKAKNNIIGDIKSAYKDKIKVNLIIQK
jgi:hypothetical protein